MRTRFWAAALALAVTTGAAPAQPAEPAVEVRLRSVNDLLDKAEYVGGLVDKADPIKMARDFIKHLSADGKGIEGIDPGKPFGAYVVVATDVDNSPAVVMIPVADKDRLLAALKERAGIEPEKGDDGTLKATVPFVNEIVMRFADGYLYLARDAKHIPAKGVVTPKAFFAKDDGAVLSVVVRFDRIPADVRAFVTGQMEHQLQEQLKKEDGDKSAAQKKLEAILADAVAGSAKMVAEEGKEFGLKLFADAKTDDLSAEVVLTAKDGTPLAKTIAGLAGKTSLPAGVVAAKDVVGRFAAKGAVPDDLRKRLDPVIDDLLAEAVKQAKEGDRMAAQKVLDVLAPTLKSGELDAAATLAGPDAKGRHTLLVALAVKDGKGIEKLAKEFAPHVPADQATFAFDVETVGAFTLHKVTLGQTDADFDRVFGTKTVWLATSDDLLAVSIEADGAALKAGLKAKPAATPVLAVEVALAKAVPLANKDLKPDEAKAAIKDAFGDASPAGKDAVTVTVEGGKQLTLKAKVKGKGIRLGAMVSELKAK